MDEILVVAEKPSVARDIARVLGASARGEGRLTGGGYVVTWAIGHLVALKEPEELDERYKRWRAEDLPILPERMQLKVLPKTRAQFAVVKKLMNSREIRSVICATDSGREGELIFRYIYEMAGCQKPVERLWISSMTDEAIRAGFAALRPASRYDALYQSARCRSEADWLVGMNASRAFTLRYGALLSVGRVQTPTLAMLVSRRLEIDRFVPQPYWTVQADFGDYQGVWFDPSREDGKRIPDEQQARAIADKVRGRPARVTGVKAEEKRELAPQLYDLTTLQREASGQLGFSAERTLKTAQSLYEKRKLVTYPRTDSRYLSHDMGGSVEKALKNLPESYAALSASVLAGPIPRIKRVFDDTKLTDHHAIIPTGRRADPQALSPDEAKLFDLIARRLIAAFYPDMEYDAMSAVTGVGEHKFLSRGRAVIAQGWQAANPPLRSKPKKGEEEQALPQLQKGQRVPVKSAKAVAKKTTPPSPYTENTLLAAMENAGKFVENEELRRQMKERGLGTPATRAAIIERLIDVGYARRKGRQILATEKGVRLIGAVPPEIASPETTGRWEQALENIAQGGGDCDRFMAGIRRLAAFLTDYAAKSAPEAAFEKEERRGKGRKRAAARSLGIPCPACGKGQVVENAKAFGCSRWREGCRFTLWKNAVSGAGGPELNAKIVTALLKAPDGDLRGSTGTLHYHEGTVGFTPKATR